MMLDTGPRSPKRCWTQDQGCGVEAGGRVVKNKPDGSQGSIQAPILKLGKVENFGAGLWLKDSSDKSYNENRLKLVMKRKIEQMFGV